MLVDKITIIAQSKILQAFPTRISFLFVFSQVTNKCVCYFRGLTFKSRTSLKAHRSLLHGLSVRDKNKQSRNFSVE